MSSQFPDLNAVEPNPNENSPIIASNKFCFIKFKKDPNINTGEVQPNSNPQPNDNNIAKQNENANANAANVDPNLEEINKNKLEPDEINKKSSLLYKNR